MNLGGFSMISQGRSESREKFQGKGGGRSGGRGRSGGNPRYAGQPHQLFSPNPNMPTGYGPDGTTLAFGNRGAPLQTGDNANTPTGYGADGQLAFANRPDGNALSQPSQSGSRTGLTPLSQRGGYQAPNVLAMEPGIPTSTYAPQPAPKPGVQQNVKLNLDQPAPTATTSEAPQTESSNPLTGDTNSQPTGKTTGLTPRTLSVGQPQGQQQPAGSVTGLKPVQPASNQSLAQGSPQNEGYDANGQITSSEPDIDHARALGVSTKGNGTPGGDDVSTPGQPASFAGGTGDAQRQFSNSTSAAIYGDYVKKLFGGGDGSQPTGYAANGTSLQTGQDQASDMAKQLNAQPKAQPQPQAQA